MIYITEEQKELWVAEMLKLRLHLEKIDIFSNPTTYDRISSKIVWYEDLLNSSIVLLVEESWEEYYDTSDARFDHPDYLNGVIIKPQ